jgi:sortase A
MTEQHSTPLTRRDRKKRERSVTFLGVAGEVLITSGALVLLFWVWMVGINDWIQNFTQSQAAAEIAEQWQREVPEPTADTEVGDVTPSTDPPPVIDTVSDGSAFATLYVPRFGDSYQRVIAEGVDLQRVLNNPRLGVGRYPQSSALGELGNVGLAGHRTSFGASFGEVSQLRLGDRLYIETREGWFSYQFRNLEYVWPSEVEVLNPVPKGDAVETTDRLLTLTSCHPRFSNAERIIAYAVFDGWYPRSSGPPSDIAHMVVVT